MDANSITVLTPNQDPDILYIRGGAPAATEIIRICSDGRLFWKGREVETDDDFRAAMLDLAARLIPIVGHDGR